MTTTRINHTGHDHPNTPAARTACRKAMAAAPAPVRYVRTGQMIEATALTVGMIIRTTFMDNPNNGAWTTFVEYGEVVEVGDGWGEKYLSLAYRVVRTNHPTAAVGRVVTANETRPWETFELIREA